MRHWLTTLIALSLAAPTLHAATVYKKVDENGNIIFSDSPMDDSEVMDVPPVPTMKLDKIKVTPRAEPGKKDINAVKYEALTITAPEQDATFWNNGGNVTISVQVKPALAENHRVQLLLNGEKRAGPSASTSFSLSNLFRGSYDAVAQVVDAKGNVLISSPAKTFHIKQTSRLN